MRKMCLFLLTLVSLCIENKCIHHYPACLSSYTYLLCNIFIHFIVLIENKLDLIRLLSPIEYKWRQIGHALKISHGDLENILDQRNRNADRLADVIQVWLDKRPTEVTWSTIITAVDLPPVLEPSIAKSVLDMCLSKTSE